MFVTDKFLELALYLRLSRDLLLNAVDLLAKITFFRIKEKYFEYEKQASYY